MKKDVSDDKLNIHLIDYDHMYGRAFFATFGNF